MLNFTFAFVLFTTITVSRFLQSFTAASADLILGEADLESNLTAIGNDFTSITTRLAAALAYLEAGDDLINTANVAGTTAPKAYAEYAKAELDSVSMYIERVKAYISSSAISKDYATYATTELEIGNSHVAVALGNVQQIEKELDIGKIAIEYDHWASRKKTEYKNELKGLGRIEDNIRQLHPDS